MSIEVEIPELADAVEGFAIAYLLTAGPDGRPHAASVDVEVRGAQLVCGAGRTARRNIEASPVVTLLWPPAEAGGYTLIVDGEARVDGEQAVVTATHAVLHRRATTPGAGTRPGCSSDCAPVEVPEG